MICPGCENAFLAVEEPCCARCGAPLLSEAEYCADCQSLRHNFDRGMAAYIYNDAMRRCIFRFKYGGRREYASYLGEAMYERLKKRLMALYPKPEAIIPVPLHEKKLKERGYNQAALLGRRLGELSGIRSEEEIVARVRQTKPMKKLDLASRRKNLKKAFKIVRNDVELKTVLLVDDIYTTGSTVDETSKVLKEAGVKRVYVAALAIGAPV